jgi:hypothetical protein
LSNRPTVLYFQDIGAERLGSKADRSEIVWIISAMVLITEMNESEPLLKCRKNFYDIEIERLAAARERVAKRNPD